MRNNNISGIMCSNWDPEFKLGYGFGCHRIDTLTEAQLDFSTRMFGKPLCFNCGQKLLAKRKSEHELHNQVD